MANEKIIVIEDEENILELLCYNLRKAGYSVEGMSSAEDALTRLSDNRPDLLLIDVMLPHMSGLDLCKMLRARSDTRDLPIIMVSARGEEWDIVKGLEFGADDYVTKPFSPNILLARIQAVLRRRATEIVDESSIVTFGDLTIDPGRVNVKIAQEEIVLTRTEFLVLHFLARHPGWVFTRYQIVDNVKGEDYAVTDRAVDVQIVGLRKKLGPCAWMIETVRGVGYRFKEGPQ